MKSMKTLLLLPALLAVQTLFAQSDSHLKLSDQYPAEGEKVSFTYDPAGTPLDGKTDIKSVVYFMDNKDYPAFDVELKADGKLLKGDVMVPVNSKAFIIQMLSGKITENNNDKGYVYLIHRNKKPVEGAYASEAELYYTYSGYRIGIKRDKDEAIACYRKEIEIFPGSKNLTEGYYFLIANLPQYKDEYNQKLTTLMKSADEKDLMFAMDMSGYIKNTQQEEALKKEILDKFPNGTLVKNDKMTAFYREKDLHKKDSLFLAYAAKYPEKPDKNETSLDNLRVTLAGAYLQKGDKDGYEKYASQVKDKTSLGNAQNNVAWKWAEAGKNLANAEKISRESVDNVEAKLDKPAASAFTSASMAKKNWQQDWNAFADTYVYILWKENKSAEALPYMKKVYDLTSDELNSTEHYAEVLAGTGQYAQALDIIEKGMKNGQTSAVLKDELKKDYAKVKGSDNGYDKYLASLEGAAQAKVLADLAKTMINQPAPAFALKDLDGKTVSLADLKGKVVIVDFWATWCGPCKASFPGMQMAVNKYKDDPNIKFVFIDTWENGSNYEPGVKKFITDNKYTFHVLLDEKTDEGRQAKVVTTYNVEGIPTKFIIDKNGNIRFKYVGYSGSSEKVLEEVTNMITLTGNPEIANASPPAVSKSK